MGDMLKRALFFISIILPFLIIIKPIVEGNIPFWYDPARDLLMAWDSLRKPTLIGPTSGIPGIFYGPHWIWLLSIGIAISKDPRFIVFLILTLPYFILLPLSIMKLRGKLVDLKTMMSIWILSIFVLGSYANQIWSPNLAPLLFFSLLTLLYLTPGPLEKRSAVRFFCMAMIQGLLLQHHISFGVVLSVSWAFYFIYLIIQGALTKKNKRVCFSHWIVNAGSFIGGFFMMLTPFFLFEIRHGFMQTKSLFFTLNQSIAHNTPVVGQTGITKSEIIQRFIEKGASAFSIPTQFAPFVIVILSFLIIRSLIKKSVYERNDKNLLLFLCSVIIGLFFVYLSTRNPVWNYHFIGTEIIFLFLMLLAVKKNNTIGLLLFIWAFALLFMNTGSFIRSFFVQTHMSELLSKKNTVEFILSDTINIPFTYFGKNAAIYTYDYDYLFRWVGEIKKIHPALDSRLAKNIYLIIPDEMKFDKIGFTENRTPSSKYKTEQEWVREDKTIVIKRVSID